jgi:hypothetical protein
VVAAEIEGRKEEEEEVEEAEGEGTIETIDKVERGSLSIAEKAETVAIEIGTIEAAATVEVIIEVAGAGSTLTPLEQARKEGRATRTPTTVIATAAAAAAMVARRLNLRGASILPRGKEEGVARVRATRYETKRTSRRRGSSGNREKGKETGTGSRRRGLLRGAAALAVAVGARMERAG